MAATYPAGSLWLSAPRTDLSLPDRIAARIDVVAGTGCWVWTGACNNFGYGRISWDGAAAYVHRVVYELLIGPIPDELTLDHLCRNPPCCRPLHLEAVTMAENIRRATAQGCRRGHPWAPENSQTRADGRRYCRTCQNAARRARRAA